MYSVFRETNARKGAVGKELSNYTTRLGGIKEIQSLATWVSSIIKHD